MPKWLDRLFASFLEYSYIYLLQYHPDLKYLTGIYIQYHPDLLLDYIPISCLVSWVLILVSDYLSTHSPETKRNVNVLFPLTSLFRPDAYNTFCSKVDFPQNSGSFLIFITFCCFTMQQIFPWYISDCPRICPNWNFMTSCPEPPLIPPNFLKIQAFEKLLDFPKFFQILNRFSTNLTKFPWNLCLFPWFPHGNSPIS